ncbi:FecR family protein [Flavihumibacter sp. UBA7668]|uniref:FecR family protein n=1 Tax=Flavihumibacter sp. UBA7668 TaxID=1946542 RepID=UPI0025BF4713|nr:FecR family protein [Flavihumibacter sp. UBA7668]
MLQGRLLYLLDGYQKNQLNESESIELDNWFQELANRDLNYFDNMSDEEIQLYSKKMFQEIQYKIKQKEGTTIKSGRTLKFWQWAAAAMLAGCIVSMSLFWPKQVPYDQKSVAANNVSHILELVNTGLNKQIIRLNDCSIVELSPGSSIQFSSAFSFRDRIIQLNGKAYFSVQKGHKHAFTVQTNRINTTALGTSFTIDNRTESATKIKLHTGKVQVVYTKSEMKQDPVLMNPGDSLVMNKATGIVETLVKSGRKFIKPEVQPINNELLQTTGFSFEFMQTSLPDVLDQLKKGYQVTIHYDSTDLSHLYFTGKIKSKDKLGTIIKRLETLHNLRIQTTQKRLVIQKN